MCTRFWLRISLRVMRAETPSWPVSNFINVLFVCGFCSCLPLTLVYYNFAKKARAFLDFFAIFIYGEFSTICAKLLCYLTEQGLLI